MKVRITAGKHVIHAEFYESGASRKFYESLPVTYPMMNLYGKEMCYRMGNGSLPVNEARNEGNAAGDIFYWPPAGSLVILYQQNGENREHELLGHTDDDISFFDEMNDTDITFEKED